MDRASFTAAMMPLLEKVAPAATSTSVDWAWMMASGMVWKAGSETPHGDLDLDGAAKAFALADVLVVSQRFLGGGLLGSSLHVAEVDVQQLGGLSGHVAADTAAAGQTSRVAHLGDAGSLHKEGDAVVEVYQLNSSLVMAEESSGAHIRPMIAAAPPREPHRELAP